MHYTKLTHNDAGQRVAPPSPYDERWRDWVSATRVRGHMLGKTLWDWLDLYGEQRGFEKDPEPDRRLDFQRFRFRKGEEFEERVARYFEDQLAHLEFEERAELVRIMPIGASARDAEYAGATFDALAHGHGIVHSGVLWNLETRTYGVPDFLIRSDVFERLFPDNPDPYGDSAHSRAEAEVLDWRYVVVDAKFTTLSLLKKERNRRPLGNSGSSWAYKAQLFLYSEALGRLQGEAPRVAFLLGRGWKGASGKAGERGSSATEKLGPVLMTNDLEKRTNAAVNWVRDLRSEGGTWQVLPEPSRPELRPPGSSYAEWPWTGAIRRITVELDDPIRLGEVGATRRDKAVAKGITSWRDTGTTAASFGVTGAATGPRLNAILDVNRTEGPIVRPVRITGGDEVWRDRSGLEFFVDFETVNDTDDDFRGFPEKGGQPLIFMIGCGHMEEGRWRFRCFVADRLTPKAEAEAIDAWIEHMSAVGVGLGAAGEVPRVWHWSPAETTNLTTAYNSACERHPDRGWASSLQLRWFDLLNNVVRAQPVVVRGAFGFGLKEVANALHGHALIRTGWGDSDVDGLGAMVGAWHSDREAEERGVRLIDTDLTTSSYGCRRIRQRAERANPLPRREPRSGQGGDR